MSSSRGRAASPANSRRHSGLRARDSLRRRAGLPDAQQPDPVEAHRGQAVQLGVRNVVEGRAAGPSVRDSSVSQTRVLIWYSDG